MSREKEAVMPLSPLSPEMEHLEALLSGMNLTEPTDSLDGKMSRVFNAASLEDETVIRESGTLRRWPAFVATALVASLLGFLAGQFVELGSEDSRNGFRAIASNGSSQNSGLTPVKFNFAAFNLLHGHSQEKDPESCKRCHVGENNDTKQWFRGWYYGDQQFFEKHVQGVSNCSTCHAFEPNKNERRNKPKPDVPGFEHSELSNCSDCHVAGRRTKPQIETKEG